MTFFLKPPVIDMPTGSSEWDTLNTTSFIGGLNTKSPASTLRDDQFVTLTNWLIEDDGTLKVRGPYQPLDVAASKESILPDSAPPLSFFFVELGATEYTLACWDNGLSSYEVSYWDQSNNRWAGNGGGTTIKSDFSESLVKFIKVSANNQEDVIMFNGSDTPQRWTGSGASTNLGLTIPTAISPSLEDIDADSATEGKGIEQYGTYYYRFTYRYNASSSTKFGESGGSTSQASDNVLVESSSFTSKKWVSITNLPSLPTDVDRINVYRSPSGEVNGPYNFVGYTTTNTFIDKTPNGEEGREIPADDGSPPDLKNCIFFKGRIWGVGLSSGALKNKGVYSEDGVPDMFLATSHFYFPGELIGPVEFNQNIYWFTTKGIFVTPNGDVATYPKPLKVSATACTSYDSIVDVGNGLVFQGEDNIYWVDFSTFNSKEGDYPFPIGDPISNKIKAISSAANKAKSVACLHRERYYISYTSSGSVNSATLVWNVRVGSQLLRQGLTGAWSEVDWKANWLQDWEETLYSADNANKYIMEHEWAGTADYKNYTDYTGTSYNIATSLKGKLLHINDEWSEKIFRSLSVMSETSGATFSAVLSFNNGEFTKNQSFVLGSSSFSSVDNVGVWDVGQWGVSQWGVDNYGYQASHKKIPNHPKAKNVQVSLSSSDSEDTNLVGMRLYYKPLPRSA